MLSFQGGFASSRARCAARASPCNHLSLIVASRRKIATTFNTAHRTGTMACRAAPAGERTSESGRAVVRRPALSSLPLRLTTGDHRGFVGGVCARRGVARGCWRFARASRLRVSLAKHTTNARRRRDDTTTTLNAVGLKAVRPEGRQA